MKAYLQILLKLIQDRAQVLVELLGVTILIALIMICLLYARTNQNMTALNSPHVPILRVSVAGLIMVIFTIALKMLIVVPKIINL